MAIQASTKRPMSATSWCKHFSALLLCLKQMLAEQDSFQILFPWFLVDLPMRVNLVIYEVNLNARGGIG